MVARATCLIAKSKQHCPDGSIHFPDEFSITVGTFALGQVLNFRSLAYVTDCYDKLHLLKEVVPTGTEPLGCTLC
jgi:hypothetical protein